MPIVNLTRSMLPKISDIKIVNINNIKQMPEQVLRSLIRNGDKRIVHVDMNHCVGAVIKKDGIHTVFTDSLAGCNSVGAIVPLNTDTLCILSHYVPTNVEGQASAIENQLKIYENWISKKKPVQLFFNIREVADSKSVTEQNPIINRIRSIFSKFFGQEPKLSVTQYQISNRSPFFSTANIFQFDTASNTLKITNVGEQEKFVKF